ncbi:MAG: histidinol-phosphatase, partial [Phycisphaerae bacterium]|nr:histidinol-phosphatase [Phycisphaerae bacterium]NIT57413.1 histidinol-phosphatase [Fodinibius sp.]NIU57337.1 histidinol-phosphatase [Phycisphaerae bacterium]NIV12329.1 histidinol-phosphatase [Fodinibius sp.]NIW93770.1 histidinol-phosphatase [Phycisphaerae bacterium]
MKKLCIALSLILIYLLVAPFALGASRAKIHFPDILGYKTLKCDFHMHTVFSDGKVWPTVRIDEAVREGLDVISITDHIEYQPHKEDIPTNHNRVFEIASEPAKKKGVLLIKGAEITRETPPGHFNAIFLEDINPIDTKEFLDAVKAANEQNAFVFWNHPGWKPEAKGWFDVHTKLYKSKWMHGIEVANGDSYYPDGHKWCLEKGLTMMGTSDIHDPSLITETTPGNHR